MLAQVANDVLGEFRGQELCESGGGRPGLPSLISPAVSVDVKQHLTNGRIAVTES